MPYNNKSGIKIAFIGSAGIPNRYGGFESFLENCAPTLSQLTDSTLVTCDSSLYKDDLSENYLGVRRVFINVKANGPTSVIHDLLAFFQVYRHSTHIMVLGVSGGIWFPFFLLMCRLGRKRLGVNIDGVEWRRTKFSLARRRILKLFDYLAQRFSDLIVYDNAGLEPYVYPFAKNRAIEISYSGDHVLRTKTKVVANSALTICRIEPENNIEMLIRGVLRSNLELYTIVGNWSNSDYGRILREQYNFEPRLRLLDPIYESNQLAKLREESFIYLHGHSVGGTNPSLVEMLYYDNSILCFDVIYNRFTAGNCASYFSNENVLSEKINELITKPLSINFENRKALRLKYQRNTISNSYVKALKKIKSN